MALVASVVALVAGCQKKVEKPIDYSSIQYKYLRPASFNADSSKNAEIPSLERRYDYRYAIMLGAANAALSMGRIPGKDLELGGANADDAVFLFPYPLHTFNIISSEIVNLLIERMTDSEDCRILLKSDSFRTQTAAGRIFANPADPLREYLALSHINEDGNLPSVVLEGRNDQISS